MHYDRLFAALCKYYSPMTKDQFWHGMDLEMTQNAVNVSEFPKHVEDWIFEKDYKPFQMIGKR